MAKLNGKTPEEISHEIIEDAVTPIMVEIDGTRGQKLDELLRYKFSKKIYSKGEKWLQRNLDALRQEYLESLIDSFHKSRQKADEKQEKQDSLEYYQLLVSRGWDVMEAMVEAGLAPKKTEEPSE